jgi:predicted MFS family arabinose efflux permease
VGMRGSTYLGFGLAILANVASALATAYVALLSLRVVAGIGGGLAVGVCYATLGRSRSVDRNFAIYVVCQVLFGAGAIAIMPSLETWVGTAGVFAILAAVLTVLLPIYRFLPSRRYRASVQEPGRSKPSSGAAWVGLSSVFVFFVAQGAIWAYIEVIGVRGGVDPQAAADGLAIATLIGLCGPATAAVAGSRFGRLFPLMIALAIAITASLLLSAPLTVARFGLAACLFSIAWNLNIPYQLSSIAAADKSGSVVGWAASVSLAGLAVGPPVAATTLEHTGLPGVIWLSAALCILSLICLMPALMLTPGKSMPACD